MNISTVSRLVCTLHPFARHLGQFAPSFQPVLPEYMHIKSSWGSENKQLLAKFVGSMEVRQNFITELEEASILNEIEPYLQKMKYEFDHWDDAIHGYRETERLQWNAENNRILDRVREAAFSSNVSPIKYVHILDLSEKGYIKPHIDAIRFCGDTIAGICLLSDCVMRLVHDKNKGLSADVLLKRFALYIMKSEARYDFTHEVLRNEDSYFGDARVAKSRRVSVICRNEPS